jgi:hypothetical protein
MMNITTALLIAITIAWGIAFFLVNLFECGTKIDANWGPSLGFHLYCVNTNEMNLAYCYSDLILDVIIMVLPVYKVCKTNSSDSF